MNYELYQTRKKDLWILRNEMHAQGLRLRAVLDKPWSPEVHEILERHQKLRGILKELTWDDLLNHPQEEAPAALREAIKDDDHIWRGAQYFREDVLATAGELLGGEDAAMKWLTRPHPALDGKAPMEMLDDPKEIATVMGLLEIMM